NDDLLVVRIRKVNRERIAHSGNRINETIGKLSAQHRCNTFAAAFESLSEGITRIAAFRTHVTRIAAIEGGISKRVHSKHLQKLRHGKGRSGAEEKHNDQGQSLH